MRAIIKEIDCGTEIALDFESDICLCFVLETVKGTLIRQDDLIFLTLLRNSE